MAQTNKSVSTLADLSARNLVFNSTNKKITGMLKNPLIPNLAKEKIERAHYKFDRNINKVQRITDRFGIPQDGRPLQIAIAKYDGKEVKKLLSQGACPEADNGLVNDDNDYFNTDDYFNTPPLTTAILMKKRRDIFHPSDYPKKRTPNHEMVKDLLKAGADPDLPNNVIDFEDFDDGDRDPITPVEAAMMAKDHKSLAHLISYGADTSVISHRDPTLIKAREERAAKRIQYKFRDAVVNPETRYGQIRLANDYKAVHSKVFDNSLKTMDQLIAASDRKKAFEKQAPRKITKAHESPFGNRKKYSRKNKKR